MVLGWFWGLWLRILVVLGFRASVSLLRIECTLWMDRHPTKKTVSLQDRARERDQRRQERAADDARCTEDRPGRAHLRSSESILSCLLIYSSMLQHLCNIIV